MIGHDVPAADLTDGARMPLLGLGVWQIEAAACVDAVLAALELGYRHIDTAQDYGNEASVGEALRQTGVPRDEIFVTTKFLPDNDDPAAELERSLERLGTDYVDLYLVHWPQGGPTWAWPGMERARAQGHARSIGVSNFSAAELHRLLATAEASPVVNQLELSPFTARRGLLEVCRERGIVPEAYSPLGTGIHLGNPTVQRVADSIGRTPAQVLIRWCIEQGIPAIPKSAHHGRMAENAAALDFALGQGELDELNGLDETGGTDLAREDIWW